MDTLIYYFTATGNSFFVAKELVSNMENAQMLPIIKAIRRENFKADAHKIGFVFPLYYGGIPPIVENFIKTLDITTDSYIFAVVTRGASKGMVKSQLSSVLQHKGAELSYLKYITMPANYIRMYNIKEQAVNENIIKKAMPHIKAAATDITNNKINIEDGRNIEKLFYKIAYGVWKRSLRRKDNNFKLNDKCTSCGICENICPTNNIIILDGTPKWLHKCADCMACIHVCPNNAIDIGKRTTKRRRYRNPYVDIKDIIEQKRTLNTQ